MILNTTFVLYSLLWFFFITLMKIEIRLRFKNLKNQSKYQFCQSKQLFFQSHVVEDVIFSMQWSPTFTALG